MIILIVIFLIPAIVEMKAQSVVPPQVEMYLTEVPGSEGVIEFRPDSEYDYVYQGSGLVLIFVEFYAPNVFEVILTKNGRMEKFWSSGIFENDTVEYIWDTSLDGEGIYVWSFVAFNFGQIAVVNSSVTVKIEQGFLTPRKLFFGIVIGSLSLVVIAWFINQRTSKMRKNR